MTIYRVSFLFKELMCYFIDSCLSRNDKMLAFHYLFSDSESKLNQLSFLT